MNVFQKSNWIWDNQVVGADTYCEFIKEFDYDGGKCVCNLSCDSDYTLFVNGKFVESNQYPDFEHYKIYDHVDITPYLKKGENLIAILVWHFGVVSQKNIVADPGLIFEVISGDELLCSSDNNTKVRMSLAYQSGRKKKVTFQFGYGFAYDASKEDDWITGVGLGFKNADVVQKNCKFYPRANQKLKLCEKCNIKILSNEQNKRFVIDLGRQTVGIPCLELYSNLEQKIIFSWGENLNAGRVERIIGARDFSFDYIAKVGENEYINYMFRLGCRYLEVECDQPIELKYAGVIPQVYPVIEKRAVLENEFDQRIYDICLRTMQLCMMERYVDCPWREQCLYAFDSRNQMLFGYYAYENGNAEYAKSNLLLISKDKRPDELLSICFPCSMDLTIPSFSLHYILAVKEYVEYTGDITIIGEVYEKIDSLLNVFLKQIREGGLACKFEEKQHWNFYDWSPHSEGGIMVIDEPIPDLLINSLLILALDAFDYICKTVNKTNPYSLIANGVREKAYEKFFIKEEGLFSTTGNGNDYTELANSLALLAKIPCDGKEKEIAKKLANGELIACSLSNKIFKYRVLLDIDTQKHKQSVLDEIHKDFKIMFDGDATSVWETIKGKPDQLGAGSLCHAWGCVPIYIYNRLGMIKS